MTIENKTKRNKKVIIFMHTFAQFCGPKNSLSPAGNLEFCPSCPDFPLPDEPDEPEEWKFINNSVEDQKELYKGTPRLVWSSGKRQKCTN